MVNDLRCHSATLNKFAAEHLYHLSVVQAVDCDSRKYVALPDYAGAELPKPAVTLRYIENTRLTNHLGHLGLGALGPGFCNLDQASPSASMIVEHIHVLVLCQPAFVHLGD